MRDVIRMFAAGAAGAAMVIVLLGATSIQTDGDIVSSGNVWGENVIALAGLSTVGPVQAIGVIESTSGGFKFPDGTVQNTAAGTPDPPCFNATHRFVDCGNGTVTDTGTGLIFLKNANCFGSQDWLTANQSAAGLADSTCGLTDGSRPGDWRLPMKEEWEEILDSSCTASPKIFGNQSPVIGCYTDAADPDSAWASNVEHWAYWSSNTWYDYQTTFTWAADTVNGSVGTTEKANSFYVWPVRGGQ